MTTKTELLQVIRKHCLNCVSGSYSEVENCTSWKSSSMYSACVLYPYRFGVDPMEASEARKEAARRMNERKATSKYKGSVEFVDPVE
jgi:hypothetical protein